jgi:hypothetical protein
VTISGQRPSTANGNTGGYDVAHTLCLQRSPLPDQTDERRRLERLVNEAAKQIARCSAPEAYFASAADGVIIDIRSQDARQRHGVIPGSLHIPRTVLDWRVALNSPWRNLHLGDWISG